MSKQLVATCMLALFGFACGDDDAAPSALPYNPDETRVIGGDAFFNAPVPDAGTGTTSPPTPGSGVTVGTPNGDQCAELDGVCVNPQNECGDDGRADVLLDENGVVIDVICYPIGGVAIENHEGPIDDVGNNVVLVLDDSDDGVDVEGDVTIDGNNVTLFGHGPDTSVIGGDLNIDKNDSLVSGVRVLGDVVIDKNNPSLVDCVVEGNLTILGNNVSIALCEVWGELRIEGNNAILVSNAFAQPPVVVGQNLICHDNVGFADANEDGVVDEGEFGAPVECTNKK